MGSKSGLIGVHSFGHRNNVNFVLGRRFPEVDEVGSNLVRLFQLTLLFVLCLFFVAACVMTTLRVSSRSDFKNGTSAFKEPVLIADEEPDSRRRSCTHIKESANNACPESSDRKKQQQQQSISSNIDQTATEIGRAHV